jgi:hypothetical protein
MSESSPVDSDPLTKVVPGSVVALAYADILKPGVEGGVHRHARRRHAGQRRLNEVAVV